MVMTEDTIVIHSVTFTDDADLDISEDDEVANYDELVNAGKTITELRALKDTEQNREHIPTDMIVEKGDPLWSSACENLAVGESKQLIE